MSYRKILRLNAQVHALAVKMGIGCNHFIWKYARHGKPQEAIDVFREVTLPDPFMWSSMLAAQVKQGQPRRATELYQHVHSLRIKPDMYLLAAALHAWQLQETCVSESR